MRELTRQQSRPPVSLQEGVQERSLWPLPVGPEQKLLQYRSKDGSLGCLVSDHNKVNECTGRRRTGGVSPTTALAPKHLASRYFQLKLEHAAIGTYLYQIHAREDTTCQGCGSPRETIHHLLFECRKWRRQRNKLYRDLEMDGVMKPTATEEYPQGRLLREPRATRALLQFLANTSVALPRTHLQRTAERTRRGEEWGLEALEASRTGEG